ncbi:hypothetical protein PMIN07_010593 [Paraphaeosphaeria minitans]
MLVRLATGCNTVKWRQLSFDGKRSTMSQYNVPSWPISWNAADNQLLCNGRPSSHIYMVYRWSQRIFLRSGCLPVDIVLLRRLSVLKGSDFIKRGCGNVRRPALHLITAQRFLKIPWQMSNS